MLPENATKNGWQQFFAALCFLAHMCSWPYIFFLSTEGGKVSFAAKAARHQICIVSAPAMFPQNCYKTHSSKGVCCYDKKKLILLDWSYGWSRRICHCSSPTDWISIKSLDIKKPKKHLALRAEALHEWLKCILDTHRTPCDALLPLAHADALFQCGAFLEHQIPAAVRIPGPHTGTEIEKEQMLTLYESLGQH